MGTETRFVDITYRGLKVATKAKLVEQEAMTGFVELEAPMPVGTRVTLQDGAQTMTARVLGVVEQESGAKSPPGMRISWADAAEKPAMDQTQPDIPLVSEAEAQALYDADASTPPAETAAPAADAPADSSTTPAEEGPNGGRRRRKTKRTQVGRP